MKWYKKIAIGLLSGVSLMSLGACSNHATEDADGKVTIEYFNQKGEMTDTLREIASDFEKEHENVTVKVVNVPGAGEVLKTRVLAGDIPDIINIFPQSIEFQEWSKAGYFEELTDKDYMQRIKNNYAQKYAIDGKLYNIPYTANAYGIYYNKDAFDKLGLEVPQTWDEFEKVVDQIIAAGKTPFAVAGADTWTLNGYHQLAFSTITGNGQKANDYLRFSKPNAIQASDEVLKEDAKRLDLLRKKGAMQKNWQGAGYTDVVGAFARGDALMTVNGSWAITAINAQEPSFKVGTFPFPGEKAGESFTIGAGDLAWSISATSKHPKEANAFVEYMSRPEVMQKYYDVDGSPTAVKGVKEAGADAPLAGLAELAFTDRHLVWLAQDWTSESDFYTLTGNYLTTGNRTDLAKELNAFFNPMKADVE